MEKWAVMKQVLMLVEDQERLLVPVGMATVSFAQDDPQNEILFLP